MSEDTAERQVTTVQKLKSLIEAIDLMSEEEEWTPTAKQWRRIKMMIETLEEPEPAMQAAPRRLGPPSHAPAGAGAPTQLPQSNRPNPLESGQVQFPEVPSAIPADAPRVPTGQSALSPAPQQQPQTGGQGEGNGEAEGKPPTSPGL